MNEIQRFGINSAVTDIRTSPVPPATQTLVADTACQQAASSYYSYGYASAVYIKGTGNSCLVTF